MAICSVPDFLKLVASAKRRPCVERFLLVHGQAYEVNAKTYEGPRGTQHLCFMNATLEALDTGRSYVEGYIMVCGCPIEHAWTVDRAGQVYDPTLEATEDIGGYFGVAFNGEYLKRCAQTNKYYGLLGLRSKNRQALIEGKINNFKGG
jgi:hypothetical protein